MNVFTNEQLERIVEMLDEERPSRIFVYMMSITLGNEATKEQKKAFNLGCRATMQLSKYVLKTERGK